MCSPAPVNTVLLPEGAMFSYRSFGCHLTHHDEIEGGVSDAAGLFSDEAEEEKRVGATGEFAADGNENTRTFVVLSCHGGNCDGVPGSVRIFWGVSGTSRLDWSIWLRRDVPPGSLNLYPLRSSCLPPSSRC